MEHHGTSWNSFRDQPGRWRTAHWQIWGHDITTWRHIWPSEFSFDSWNSGASKATGGEPLARCLARAFLFFRCVANVRGKQNWNEMKCQYQRNMRREKQRQTETFNMHVLFTNINLCSICSRHVRLSCTFRPYLPWSPRKSSRSLGRRFGFGQRRLRPFRATVILLRWVCRVAREVVKECKNY